MVERLRLEQVETPEFLDAVHALLSDSVRRNALQYLTTQRRPVTVRRLATELAAVKYGVPSTEVLTEHRREVVLHLRHAHLPALHDAGVIDWDRERDRIALTPLLDQLSVTIPGSGGLPELTLSSRPELG
ncbi:hypothetical protein [Natrinema sp. 1APR25-10V2]|uniref:DUF7344 domain-containing protein n=1 Tax=Natrinema sp. 1APR25-10V2 TaxID=2951081 RepID=UPI00287414CF|nr:hypothetical protein [Natrinema sp. 1APR25-10V2]MDS0477753.1 hypothetical protein [Natrinema sp. 1APR25-10V2]